MKAEAFTFLLQQYNALLSAQHFNGSFQNAVEYILLAAALTLEKTDCGLLGVGVCGPVELNQLLLGRADLHGSLGGRGGRTGLLAAGGGLFGRGAALGGVDKGGLSHTGGFGDLLEGSLGELQLATLGLRVNKL